MESSLRRTKREQHGRFVPKPGSRNSRSNLPRESNSLYRLTSLKSAPMKTSATSQFHNPYVSVEVFGFGQIELLVWTYKQEVEILSRPTCAHLSPGAHGEVLHHELAFRHSIRVSLIILNGNSTNAGRCFLQS